MRIFRHDISFHGKCFRACAVLTQLEIENGYPLFDCSDYVDPPIPPLPNDKSKQNNNDHGTSGPTIQL
jgi:hypothetical protein